MTMYRKAKIIAALANEELRYWIHKSNCLICVCGSFGFIINQCSFPRERDISEPVADVRTTTYN